MKQIEVYTIDELSNEARERVLRNYEPEFFFEPVWYIEQLAEKGFEVDKIWCSVSWSQGDYANFDGTVIKFEGVPWYLYELFYNNYRHEITEGKLVIERLQVPTNSDYVNERLEDLARELYLDYSARLKEANSWLYREIRNELEYCYSDENKLEDLRVQEHYYTREGVQV